MTSSKCNQEDGAPHFACIEKRDGNCLPNRFINIAVPVNFFHRERAFGTFFPNIAPAGFTPLVSAGLVNAASAAALLVEEEGAVGSISVDAIPENCPDTEGILKGFGAEGGRREAGVANIMKG